jgi:2-methylcitrate dehydratase PrpD
VQDPQVMAFQDKVEAIRDPSISADAAEVTITLKDGRSHTCRIDHCIGSAANPMTDAQLTAKFAALAEPVIGAVRSKALIEQSWTVETMADVGELTRAAA